MSSFWTFWASHGRCHNRGTWPEDVLARCPRLQVEVRETAGLRAAFRTTIGLEYPDQVISRQRRARSNSPELGRGKRSDPFVAKPRLGKQRDDLSPHLEPVRGTIDDAKML